MWHQSNPSGYSASPHLPNPIFSHLPQHSPSSHSHQIDVSNTRTLHHEPKANNFQARNQTSPCRTIVSGTRAREPTAKDLATVWSPARRSTPALSASTDST